MLRQQDELRTLYLPFYEDLPSWRFRTVAGIRQRRQKRGLREALSRRGPLRLVDYRRVWRRLGRRGFLEFMLQEQAAFRPNLILTEIPGAGLIKPEDVKALRRKAPGALWVNWNGDYQDFALLAPEDIEIASLFDLQLAAAYDNVEDYGKRGVRSRYWQIGWETDGVGQAPHFLTPRHDLLFLASKMPFYPARQELVARLRGLPIKFGLYGRLWPGGWARGNCLYDFKQGCRLMRAASLILADNPRPRARGYVSNRLFQSLAAGGAPVLMQYFHDYESLGLKDGEHLVIWRDFGDLKAKIAHWLKPEQAGARRTLAAAGQRLCLKRHSFEIRVQELLGFLAEIA